MRAHIAPNIDLNQVECGPDTYNSKYSTGSKHDVSSIANDLVEGLAHRLPLRGGPGCVVWRVITSVGGGLLLG